MFVRTTYATGDPAKLDEAVRKLTTEGREPLEQTPGFRGAGVFVDRELGKLMIGTWWQDEEALRSSAERMGQLRSEMLSPFAATLTVDNWEAAVAQRAESVGEAARFRLTRVDFDPSHTDLMVDAFRDGVLPRLQAMPGFLGGSLLIDRAGGRGIVGAIYADRDTFAASRAPAAAMRGEVTTKTRATLRSVEEFEAVMVISAPPS
ncbi:hypothetical protein [Streptomyces sp. NPDC006551]|uniref:hypothetical protein n=1 Tax=Streptomyces sp. NPDC006551 TaxID=3157178 RepID=UPI0033B9145D